MMNHSESTLRKELALALRTFVRLSGAKSGSIFLYRPDKKMLTPEAWEGGCWVEDRRPRAFALGEGIAGQVALKRAPIYCPDVRQAQGFVPSTDDRAADVRTLMSVPIIRRRMLLGVINIDHTIVDAFDPLMRQLLLEFAEPVAAVIEKELVLSRSRSTVRERNLLLQVGRVAATHMDDVPELLRQVCQAAVELVGGNAFSTAYLYDASKPTWETRFTHRQQWGEDTTAPTSRYPRRDGMGAWVLAHQRERISEAVEEIHPEKQAQVAVCLPLRFNHETVGLLYVYRRDAHQFTHSELRVLRDFAANAAIATKYARLFETLRQGLAALKRTTLAVAAQRELEDTLDCVLDQAIQVSGATRGWLRLLMVEPIHSALGELLSHQSSRNFDADYLQRPLLLGEGITGEVARTGEPIRVDDLVLFRQQNPHITPAEPRLIHSQSWLCPSKSGPKQLAFSIWRVSVLMPSPRKTSTWSRSSPRTPALPFKKRSSVALTV